MDSHSKDHSPVKRITTKTIFLNRNESPFSYLPNVSTPPPKCAKIKNPFETHLIDKLHLPVFSPTVFANKSTPKNLDKFKWSIDDISCLKPADIDESAVEMHVSEYDSSMETLMQDRINKFFNDQAIVPSPLNEEVKPYNLLLDSPMVKHKNDQLLMNESTQTELSLPGKLPQHIEEVLQPYYGSSDSNNSRKSDVLYNHLFASPPIECLDSSPAPSSESNLSPIQFSPVISQSSNTKLLQPENTTNSSMCNLSPLFGTLIRRPSFSEQMSISVNEYSSNCHNCSMKQYENSPNDSITKMLTTEVDIDASPKHCDENFLNKFHESTPHLKIFASSRRKLSDSFKNVNYVDENAIEDQKKRIKANRLFNVDYHTETCNVNACDVTMNTITEKNEQ